MFDQMYDWGRRGTPVCFSKLGQRGYRSWPVACLAPNRYLNQCLRIVNVAGKDKYRSDLKRNRKCVQQRMNLKMFPEKWRPFRLNLDLLLPRVRGFWSRFGSVCSLTYCNGNFRVTMVSELFNVIFVCNIFCSSLIRRFYYFCTWIISLAVLYCEILWPDLAINFHLKKQNVFNEIWSISSSPSVEWSPATTGRVDADILNGSCDVWGSRDFLPYIWYNLLKGVNTITLDSWLVYLLTKLYNWWHVDWTCFESFYEICKKHGSWLKNPVFSSGVEQC